MKTAQHPLRIIVPKKQCVLTRVDRNSFVENLLKIIGFPLQDKASRTWHRIIYTPHHLVDNGTVNTLWDMDHFAMLLDHGIEIRRVIDKGGRIRCIIVQLFKIAEYCSAPSSPCSPASPTSLVSQPLQLDMSNHQDREIVRYQYLSSPSGDESVMWQPWQPYQQIEKVRTLQWQVICDNAGHVLGEYDMAGASDDTEDEASEMTQDFSLQKYLDERPYFNSYEATRKGTLKYELHQFM